MGGPCACFLFLILCIITTTITDGLRVGGGEHNGQVCSCHEREKQALLKFKQSFSSDPFNRLSSWVEEQDCCLWSGVTCNNVTGHVTKLDLRNIQQDDWNEFPIYEKALKGNVLNPCLLELPSLSYLDLSGNHFNWTSIPSFLGSFIGLRHLDLSDANFGGRVPYQIGNLSNLQYLRLGNRYDSSYLYVNDLDWLSNLSSLKHLDMSGIYLGNIIHWFDNINRLTSLTELHLRYCSVHEISSFTTTINFTSIEVLDLSRNHLRCHDLKIVQNLTSLLRLDLSYNDLDCPIPHVFNKMAFLTQLDLSGSQLEGTITDVFSGLMNLVDLRLSYNNLTGHLPDGFRGMTSLKRLSLSDNKFSGHLPDVFGGMASLTILGLRLNNFSGSLPQSINQLLELRVLDVSLNSLDEVISESHLSNLSKLQRIDISFNSLHCKFSSDWIPPLQLNEINMPSCSMGPLFPSWLQSLKNLSHLDISDNGIRGTIPSWYWSITSSTMTYMNLSHNHIVGKLPYLRNVASNLPDFLSIIIDLSSNQLEGPIPQIFEYITSLNLSKNRFSGSLSSFLCNAKSLSSSNELSFLDLSENLLSGEIPYCWMHWPAITVLNLANNSFSGEIPRSMGLMKMMNMLILRNNYFTGDLHFLSKNLAGLGLLDVSDNRLSGSIPKWIGELQSLQVLMLRSNELDGSIPAQLCHLGDLRILDLAHNKLQGNIPHCIGNFSALTRPGDENFIGGEWPRSGGQGYEPRVMLLWKGREYEFKEILQLVKMIDLSSNQLYGVIPEELTKLLELVALNLSRNHLTGTIPNKVGSLEKLESLDFSRNRLSGHIPNDMSNLTFLTFLDLSNNSLSGEIPLSTQLQSFDASSFTGNSELCGLPLPKKCETPHQEKCETPHQAPPLTVDDEDDIPIWFYIGLGLGYSVGISGVFLCLVLNRSWRIVYFGFVEKVTDWVYVVTVVNKRKLQRRMSSCMTT